VVVDDQKLLPRVLVLLLFACVLAMTWQVTVAYDIWWQLANGRTIWDTGGLITADSFTFTIDGAPYLDKYWLFELVTYGLYSVWGWAGLTGLRMVLVVATVITTLVVCRCRPSWQLMLVVVPAVVLLELRINLRGYWLSYLLWPIVLTCAQRAFSSWRSWRSFLPLWGLQILWTNLHSEFFWGVLIAGFFAAESCLVALIRRRGARHVLVPLLGVSGMAVACCCNPFFARLPLGVISEARLVALRPVSSEWLGFATFSRPLSWTALCVFAGLVLASFVEARVRCRHRSNHQFWWSRLTLFVLLIAVGLHSIRFVGPLVLAGVVFATQNWRLGRKESLPWGSRQRLVGLVVVLALVGVLWATCTDRLFHWQGELKRFGFGMLTSEMPVAASRFLAAEGLGGNFLTLWSDGNYLIWHNAGRVKVAEDGRTAPFPVQLSERLRALYAGDQQALAQLDGRYEIDGAVVPWYCWKLHRLLSRTPQWRLLFVGPYASVWMKEPSAVSQCSAQRLAELAHLERFLIKDAQAAWDEEQWLSFAGALYRRASVFAAVGRTDLVAELMTTARRNEVEDPVLDQLFATVLAR